MDRPVRIGCSGWQYDSWRGGAFYPERCPQRNWLSYYARQFETVEVNSTFYRLARPAAVAKWVEETPSDFVLTLKASRYLTHVKRLRDIEEGIANYYAAIEPLVGSAKLGPVLWQLPGTFKRDEDRLAEACALLPEGRHCWEFRHESWFTDDVYAILRAYGCALVFGDHPERPWQPLELTADWTFVRFHYGHRGRRGNYSQTELEAWAARLRDLRSQAEVFVYFNNDWEAFAPRNARRLRSMLDG